jgi:hypothetical protein
MSLDGLRRVGQTLDIRVDLVVRWRAGELDRQLNSATSNDHPGGAMPDRALAVAKRSPEEP